MHVCVCVCMYECVFLCVCVSSTIDELQQQHHAAQQCVLQDSVPQTMEWDTDVCYLLCFKLQVRRRFILSALLYEKSRSTPVLECVAAVSTVRGATVHRSLGVCCSSVLQQCIAAACCNSVLQQHCCNSVLQQCVATMCCNSVLQGIRSHHHPRESLVEIAICRLQSTYLQRAAACCNQLAAPKRSALSHR